MLEGVPEWKSNVAAGGVLLEMLAVALLIMGWLWVELLPEGVLMMAVGAGLLGVGCGKVRNDTLRGCL